MKSGLTCGTGKVTVLPALFNKVMVAKSRVKSDNWSFPVLESSTVTDVLPLSGGGTFELLLPQPVAMRPDSTVASARRRAE
jgi:hypothetical protein